MKAPGPVPLPALEYVTLDIDCRGDMIACVQVIVCTFLKNTSPEMEYVRQLTVPDFVLCLSGLRGKPFPTDPHA